MERIVSPVGQLALPGMDMRPRCPICGQPSAMLAQWTPYRPWFVCRTCALAAPYPLGIFERATARHSKTAQLDGWAVRRDADSQLLNRRVALETHLQLAVRGCKLANGQGWPTNVDALLACQKPGYQDLSCPVCRETSNPFYRAAGWLSFGRSAREQGRSVQACLPVCERCGRAHDHTSSLDGLPWHRCQRCDDELGVEALWRNRAIFGADDDENILDRLYRAHRALFDRGVLPGYWYQLRLQERAE